MVFTAVFALASCSKKKSHDYKEQVSKEITAEEGGIIESSDGNTSIEIPAGALDENTKITMTIYDAAGYPGTEDQTVVSKVVEFEPSGTVFKKPVFISMISTGTGENLRAAGKKVVTAAVYREEKGEWSYSRSGAAVKVTREAGGDPIMTSAAGDPIMLSAAGDPIMTNAAGDPIMLSAAGDPIMVTAAGDPIMTTAAGDPIMMTTGHFTAYAFFFTDAEEEAEEPGDDTDDIDISDIDTSEDDDEPLNDEDETPDEIEDEDELPDEPEDEDPVVPEPEKVYSLVPCTGIKVCVNDELSIESIECPKEGEEFYGQDAQYAIRRSCIPRSFETVEQAEEDEIYPMVYDNVTKLTWLQTDERVNYVEENEFTFCDELEYAGYDDWRLPTPKEIMTLTVNHTGISGYSLPRTNFPEFHSVSLLALEGDTYYYYFADPGDIELADTASTWSSSYQNVYYMCVRGEEYGKVNENTYEIRGEGNAQVVFDLSTNLLWQKGSVSGITTLKDALSYCESLDYAGYTDWRLPNRNELMSLVDYSKAGTGMVSSFPGMEAEEFMVSTVAIRYPEGITIDLWSVFMDTGRISSTFNYYGDGSYSVRCVRSDLDAAPADGIPECNEKIGYTPCRDTDTGIVWSMILSNSLLWDSDTIAEACTNAVMHGKNQWRLPTVDEIRTLVKDENLKSGGECGITTAENHLGSSDYDEEKCRFEEDHVFESKFLDYGELISGDIVRDEDEAYNEVWNIDPFHIGGITGYDLYDHGSYIGVVVRCVLDESLSELEAPYTDPQTELSWSDISMNVTYSDAEAYCDSLNEDYDTYWRVPTMAELQTLVTVCEDAPCKTVTDGRYSVFGDTGYLWAEDAEMNALNFFTAEAALLDDSFSYAGVRCVSSGPNPCKENTCASVEHSTGGCFAESESGYSCICNPGYEWEDGTCILRACSPETGDAVCIDGEHDLIWSSLAPEKMEWGDAGTYCETLEEDGCTDWTLPAISALRTIIINCTGSHDDGACVISEPDHLAYSERVDADCSCSPGSAYSLLGDGSDINLWSSSLSIEDDDSEMAWLVGFYRGNVNHSPISDSNHVRCVRPAGLFY